MSLASRAALSSYRAVLFDLDGVLTPTAEVHRLAWAGTFTPYFVERKVAAYTEDDYFEYLDGKKRYDGVASLLAARGIQLPWGTPADSGETETVCGIGNRKNDVFSVILQRDGVAPYPGSVAVVQQLLANNVPVAVVSSSQNAEAVLTASGLRQFFPVVIDGAVAVRENIAGKPAPDMFYRAAALLGAQPAEAVVIEDAISGVEAGHAGDFGLVIGVDRGVGSAALHEAGAHRVVRDLAELLDSAMPDVNPQ